MSRGYWCEDFAGRFSSRYCDWASVVSVYHDIEIFDDLLLSAVGENGQYVVIPVGQLER